MCGRYTLTTRKPELEHAFGLLDLPDDYRPRYNIAPSQEVLAVVADDDGEPTAAWLRWGLVPFWAQDPAIGNRLINARSETAADKPAFRAAFARRRCLVLADGYYEWWQRPGLPKQPMRIRLASGSPFAMAGLWERWDRGDSPLRTCAILTTDASAAIKVYHHRMPALLGPDDAARWLDPGAPRPELEALLCPWDGEPLDAYPVSTRVNAPRNDDPACIEPLDTDPVPGGRAP